VFGCGVLAAAALGKVAPVIPQLRDGLGLSLAGAGWVVSAITAVPALLGTPAGLWIRRRGGRRALLAGLVILAVAGAAGAAAPDARSMLVARLVEGVGFLLVVVAGPSLLAGMAGRTEQPLVLALWGTCIPIGLAASAFGGGALAGPLGWRLWLAVPSVLAVPAALSVSVGVPERPLQGAGNAARPRLPSLRRPALLAGGFFTVAVTGVPVLAVLPTFLVERRGAGAAAAGTATAMVALASVLGSVAAGWLLRRGLGLRGLAAIGLLMPLAIWPAMLDEGSLGGSVLGAALSLVVNGAVVAAVFAAVPGVVAATDQVAVANGLVAQFGSAGSLLGPPLFAWAVAGQGWRAVPVLVAVFTLGGFVLLALAEPRPSA
jgi:predicted MFS family arabinose efflux permease